MSRETLHDLNTHTLIGNTDHRGTAWHYRAEDQGDEPNHYPGPIPVADVRRRLFGWKAQSRPLAVQVAADPTTMTHLDAQGRPVQWRAVPDRQAIVRTDTQAVLGVFTAGYVMHQYDQWLLTTVANVLDDTLSISSAGLLRGGAVAWVEVSVPETLHTPEGFDYRPNLLATTSFDGSSATTFKRTVTATVCDNTRDLALAEPGQEYKVKHSRYSQMRLSEARDALAIVHTLAEGFAHEVAQLAATTVTDRQWDTFLDTHVPRVDAQGQPLIGRAMTIADRRRDTIDHLYRTDNRAAPWAGTALGVLQAVNTFEHHHAIIRRADRGERNMLRALAGDYTRLDRQVYDQLSHVLSA